MDIVPFFYGEDEEYNEVYKFVFTSDTKKSKRLQDCYYTEITIDGLADDLLIKENCTCHGFFYKKSCKHIKEAKKILKEFGINFREEKNEQKTETS